MLGIDCATKAGWALAENHAGKETLTAHGVIDLSGKRCLSISTVIYELVRDLPLVDVVGIELPYLGKNVVTLRTLSRLFGRFEQAFEPTGAEIVEVLATKWQHRVLGTFGGRKRDDLKKASKIWARATFGVVLTEDEADAAGIAVHVLRERALAEKVARATAAGGRRWPPVRHTQW